MSNLGDSKKAAGNNTRPRALSTFRLVTFLRTLLALLLVPISIFGSSLDAQAAQSLKPTVELTGGPAVVELGNTVPIQISFRNVPANSYIEALIYPRLQSRSALQYMQSNGVGGYPLGSSTPLAIASLGKLSGMATIPFQVSSSAPPPSTTTTASSPSLNVELPGCAQGCEGVYPVVFAVINDGATVATKVLPMAVLAGSQPGIVPMGIAVSVDASGIPPSALATEFPALAALLSANSQQSFTLKLSSLDIAEAAQSSSAAVRNSLKTILAWAQVPGHQLIATDVVPVNLGALGASGLGQYLGAELRLSHQLVANAGGPQSQSTYLTTEHLDSSALKTLASAGISNLVTSANSVAQPNLKYTLTSGLRLEISQGTSFATLVLDPQLESDLASGGTAYENTELTVADMIQVFEDQPNDPNLRVLAVNLVADSSANIAKSNSLLGGISAGPVLRSYSDASALASLSSQSSPESWPATAIVRGAAKPLQVARRFKAASNLLDSFAGATPDRPLVAQLRLALYAALSSQLSPAKSTSEIESVVREIDAIFASVALPANRVVTLTSNRATVPVSVTSRGKIPLELRLTLSSDRLKIQGGGTQLIKVGAATNTASFVIDTKTLGIFQANLDLTTPDGKVAISATNLQIRSLTFTLAGTLLTGAALAILALWWLRTLRKGRARNRTLVPRPSEGSGNEKT